MSKPKGLKQPIHIAIDGPVAAGKSTVAKALAQKLKFTYIDTGAMYRAVTLYLIRRGLPLNDENRIAKEMTKIDIEVRSPKKSENHGRLSTVLLNGEDVSWAIRTSEVDEAVPTVASFPKVRVQLVHKQRQVARGQNVVMEGRDITYRVLPEADIKIYLTANEVVRAKRHMADLKNMGEKVNLQDILLELIHRDSQDMSRKTDPLKVVPGAWVMDSSEKSIDQIVNLIVKKVRQLKKTSKSSPQ